MIAIEQALDLAVQHHQAGRLVEAENLYRQILARDPQHADALHLLGVIAYQAGRHDISVDLIRNAIRIKPWFAEAHSNLGNSMKETGQIDDAIAAFRQAIALKPDYAEAFSNLGEALRCKGQIDEAIAACRKAIGLNGTLPEAHNNLGNALRDWGRLDESIEAYRLAISLRSAYAEAHRNLGNALRDNGQFDEAIAEFQQAIVIKPGYAKAFSSLGNALKDKGLLDQAIAAYREAVRLDPVDAEAHSNLVFSLNYDPGCDARDVKKELDLWDHQHAKPLAKGIQAHLNDADAQRRLRIGYVSPDFRDHVVGRNLMPLFREHDHQRFEIICYTQVPVPDAMTAEFQQLAERWRNIVGLSDEQVVRQIRDDHIDILVDLALHTANNRLLVFAQKPAPVQATFAGYPGSTGLSAIDYRLSDPYLDPPGMDESVYSEQTIRLPDSFWCYDPLEFRNIEVNPLPALDTGNLTFGCLNNFCKVNEEVLKLWAKVLRQVPNSRLMLLAPVVSHQSTLELLGQEGIDPVRIEFASQQSRQKYLETYNRIDVGLDTFPYNGHTTSLDSLWMGVPVVTLVGRRIVTRAGYCQLSNLGLQNLVGETTDQFVTIAVELTKNLPQLAELRSTLRQRMERSPLMDAPKFARNIESVYRRMWHTWHEKLVS